VVPLPLVEGGPVRLVALVQPSTTAITTSTTSAAAESKQGSLAPAAVRSDPGGSGIAVSAGASGAGASGAAGGQQRKGTSLALSAAAGRCHQLERVVLFEAVYGQLRAIGQVGCCSVGDVRRSRHLAACGMWLQCI
jgi:hypothetical protein